MGTELGCLLELAATSANLNGFANAEVCLGGVLFSRGTLRAARRHLEQSDATWEAGFPSLALDAAIVCRGMLALTLLVLRGRVAVDAATAIRSALVIARQQHARLWQKRVQCSLDA